jgi:DNA-binding transcriptional ArsR family regulator
LAAASRTKKKELNELLAQLVACINTVKVLTVLAERPASPKEIGEILGLKTATVSHHVKKLLDLGLVELINEEDVGGVIQHTYRAIIRPLLSTEEWEKLGVVERQRFSIWIVQLILADAAKSFQAGTFDARASRHLSKNSSGYRRAGIRRNCRDSEQSVGRHLRGSSDHRRPNGARRHDWHEHHRGDDVLRASRAE